MSNVIGAIIAGGASRRFGAPKALALVAGRRVIDRVAGALRDALGHDDIIVIVNDADLAGEIGLPHRSDEIPGAGALGGVHAALHHAREHGAHGIIAVACDMPFLSPALLRDILAARAGHDVVIPESEGRRGVEPLCAYYDVRCVDAIERALSRGDARMIGFHDDVDVTRIPLSTLRRFGDPDTLFMNLNTPADRERAEDIAGGTA